MPPMTIFFTGAPLPRDLPPLSSLPSSSSGSAASFSSCIARFAGLQRAARTDDQPVSDTLPPSTSAPAPWHSLALEGSHLATGFSQVRGWAEEYQGNAAYYAAEDATFLSTQESAFYRSSGEGSELQALEDVTSQFYEHSLALHDDLSTSQIAPAASRAASADESSYGTSLDGTTSFEPSTLGQDSVLSTSAKKPIPSAGQITNLDRLPTEAYLKSISPQTMSINIICGIISISPPKTIKTRHGSTVEIVEMLVGDEHKSGFGINFWLPSQKQKSALREALSDLRPQDLILVKNMALSNFNGKVYGQSLRKEMTKVDLLYRTRIDRTDRAGCYSFKDFGGEESELHPHVGKTKRVREWVLRFVGSGPAVVRRGGAGGNATGNRGVKRGREVAGLEEMPPDTQ